MDSTSAEGGDGTFTAQVFGRECKTIEGLLTHVGVAVLGLGGVFGTAVEEAVGGRLRDSVGEVVDLHIHVATEAGHGGEEEGEGRLVGEAGHRKFPFT